MLPFKINIFENVDELVGRLGIEGNGSSMTDLLLGAALMQYPNSIALMTKNTTDFPTNVFNLATHMLLYKRKSIDSYGFYTYG